MTIDTPTLELPNESHFRRFVQQYVEDPSRFLVRDTIRPIEVDLDQFIRDIHATRQRLLGAMPPTMVNEQSIINEESPYICIQSPLSYEYAVAAFSVLAVGGAIVPISPTLQPEEAVYFLNQCKCTVLMTTSDIADASDAIQKHASSQGHDIQVVPIQIRCQQSVRAVIDESLLLSPSRPGLVQFTSGTTGPPKGVVHFRSLFDMPVLDLPGAALLHGTTQWLSGSIPILCHMFYGRPVEIIRQDAKAFWERLREGNISFLGCSPRLWGNMMRYFQQNLANLPADKRDEYIQGIRAVPIAMVQAGSTPLSHLKFWRDLGRELTMVYGATELASGLHTCKESDPELEHCIGRPFPGTDVRLADGDHGEILVKTPSVFSHYLNNPEATKAVFTADGYYKTGDLGRRQGDDYVFCGRASTDFLRYYIWTVPIVGLELKLAEVPEVLEGYIVAVPDRECENRAAALVRLTTNESNQQDPVFDLRQLRSRLSNEVPAYMLPTLLRILGPDEAFPKTAASDKFMRKRAAEKYFSVTDNNVYPQDVEVWREDPFAVAERKAWDFGGLA